ncbi:unnamed protein product [Spodoptera exigua]|nr:unnamed protein product [Spodoptera exigua]
MSIASFLQLVQIGDRRQQPQLQLHSFIARISTSNIRIMDCKPKCVSCHAKRFMITSRCYHSAMKSHRSSFRHPLIWRDIIRVDCFQCIKRQYVARFNENREVLKTYNETSKKPQSKNPLNLHCFGLATIHGHAFQCIQRLCAFFWDKPAAIFRNRCNTCKPGSTVDTTMKTPEHWSPASPRDMNNRLS